MKKVLVIIDESNSSYDLLIWVLENLKYTIESSKLSIFAKQPQISCTPSSVGFAQIFYPFSSNLELIKLAHMKNRNIALGILEKAKKICSNHGVKAETITDAEDPKVLISDIVKQQNIDLVVLSYQQSLGKCLHNTDYDLLVVRPKS